MIQDLQRQKLEFPVICGGAALTRKYVEDDLRREYSNAVFYADDAFAGLHIMEDLATENGARETRLTEGRTVKEYAKAAAVDEETGPVFAERSPVVGDAPNTPAPPFWGVRVRKDYDLREVFKYINETALFKNQLQLKTASQSDYVRLVEEKFRPIKKQLEEEVIASGWFEPKVLWGHFPAHFLTTNQIAPEGVFPYMIRKLKAGGYRLYSRKKDAKTGKRKNLGTFSSRAAAEKHERAVQYFKRA